jgi:putative methionine-R-sulfoxide reductase with GAF domain
VSKECAALLRHLGVDVSKVSAVCAVVDGAAVSVCGAATPLCEAAMRSAGPVAAGGRLCRPVDFDQRPVGLVEASAEADIEILAARLAPLLLGAGRDGALERNLRVLRWVTRAQAIAPDVCNWTGVYYKASFALGEAGSDLVLGPFIGAPTPHQRIPLDRGICGLALREERTVNVPDVRADPRYLACSTETRSELVVPLADRSGALVAELDIDSHRAQGFDPALEAELRSFAGTFADCL